MSEPLLLNVIGHVSTPSRDKFHAPSQPDADSSETNEIHLLPGKQFELALQDLESFDRIWLVWWFHKNTHWRPRVLPPRGPAKRRGVFATRSPHRPNPIGLTCVPLLGVRGLVLDVGPLDLVDGTPILDIKPYLRTVDSFPSSNLGWLEEVEAAQYGPPAYKIELSQTAAMELDWLRKEFGIDFTARAFGLLERDPTPHRTRRILQMGDRYRMACGAWRMFYRIEGDKVVIQEVEKGYSDEALATYGAEQIVDGEAQVRFAAWKAGRA